MDTESIKQMATDVNNVAAVSFQSGKEHTERPLFAKIANLQAELKQLRQQNVSKDNMLQVADTESFKSYKEIEQLQAELKKLKCRIINLEKDRTSYKRDSEKYLAVLEEKKICPDCGVQNKVCACPFG